MDRRSRAIALVALLALSVPAATAGAASADPRGEPHPPDPDEDVLGWEAGYWHNESIDVDQSDGLSERELDALVARTMARVEYLRRLEFTETVPVEIRSREEFRARRENRTTGARLRTFDNAKFEALFLINETTDSIEVQNRNAGASILGFYSPGDDAIVLVSEGGQRSNLEVDELTLAHELVHALQDQRFNLSRYHARTRDQVNANDGLIEGDASYVEYRYRQRCEGGAWDGTCVTPSGSGGGGGDLANIGVYLVKFQPYSDGPPFVLYLYGQTGDWSAVNAAYDRPPESSEQVIHPRKYREDAPTNVTLRDRARGSWERVRPRNRPDYAVLGEAAVMTMFVYPLYDSGGATQIVEASQWLNRTADGDISDFDPLNYESAFSSGWDGDRMHVYRNAENETAYVWRLVWDSPGDAREFYDGYRRVLEYWGAERVGPDTYEIPEGGFADAIHVVVRGDTVTVVNAPTVEELSAVRAGIAVGTGTPASPPPPSPATAASPATPGVTPSETPPLVTPTGSPGPGTTATPGQPGFGALVALLAVLAAALLAARRR